MNLKRADLREANLEEANLKGANLESAHLRNASLADANFEGADLRGAAVQEANFHRANLKGANLQGVDLDAAHLPTADLHNANLTDTKLTKTVDGILTQHEAWEAHKGGKIATYQEAQLVGEYHNSNGVENRAALAGQLGQRARAGEEAAKQGGPAADHYYSELLANYPPPPTRWEAIKETAGALVGRVTERFSGSSPEEKKPPQSAPRLPASPGKPPGRGADRGGTGQGAAVCPRDCWQRGAGEGHQ